MNLQILPSALADLDRGKRFYAAFDPALGRHFLDSRRFPFAIYYQVTNGTCLVWRVLDCRQEPARLMVDLK